MMVDAFVKLIHFYETSDIDIQKIPASIDPLLTQYGQWRALEENAGLSIVEYEEKARELAFTVKLPNLRYNRDHYFFPYAESFPERHIIRKILSLAGRDKPGND